MTLITEYIDSNLKTIKSHSGQRIDQICPRKEEFQHALGHCLHPVNIFREHMLPIDKIIR